MLILFILKKPVNPVNPVFSSQKNMLILSIQHLFFISTTEIIIAAFFTNFGINHQRTII